MFSFFPKKKRFNRDELKTLNDLFRQFRDSLPRVISEATNLCESGDFHRGLELLTNTFTSGVPIIGFGDPAMMVVVSELALQNYKAGNNGEGLHFETLRWIINLRGQNLSDLERQYIWSGADPKRCPDSDVRGYYAVDSGTLEIAVKESWEPKDPASMRI